MAAVKAADPAVRCIAAAIDEPNATHAYGPEVRWRIRQGDKASYRGAARAINESSADVVNLQHEFGLYGVWRDGAYDDHCVPMLEELKKPVITTLHTVLPKPEAQIREVVRRIAERSSAIVVMAETAARLLGEVYGIERPSIVIPHGMPAIVPRGRRRLKRQLGMDHRTIISTFGLVDPRKGLEYMIAAMPQIAARHPNTLYLIVGQTHPELLRKDGERYRNELVEKIESSGIHERHPRVRARRRQGDRLHAVPARRRGARRRAWPARRRARRRRPRARGPRDPRRSGAQGRAGAAGLRVRQRDGLAERGPPRARAHA
ncbi:MAG: hypothetical protein E6H94_05025 [Chloroflexi bacterium]|nr:MAG: hypothetical protein E6H94_05025 [Chloroflexota bacterium]